MKRSNSLVLMSLIGLLLTSTLLSGCVFDEWHRAGVVRKTYIQLLKEEPSSEELMRWSNELKNGLPESELAEQIRASDKYAEMLVTKAYRDYLKREPDPTGFKTWTKTVKAERMTAEQIESIFKGSNEYKEKFGVKGSGEDNTVTVSATYADVFGRQPTEAELKQWTSAFANLQGNKDALRKAMEAAKGQPNP